MISLECIKNIAFSLSSKKNFACDEKERKLAPDE
tara:strand:+ start:946 stop:1047 length:102 start_codon:yes stop_codon:yes gene_type:complete